MPTTVLYINAVSWIGGAERVLLDLVTNLDHTRFRPVVVCPDEGELPAALRAAGIETHIVWFHGLRARNPLRYLETVAKVRAIARESSARLVHVNQQYCSNYGVLAGKLCGLPVVVHLRGMESDRFLDGCARWLVRADRVVCISETARLNLLRYAFEHTGPRTLDRLVERSCTVYDGLDVAQRGDQPPPGRAEFGIPEAADVIGIVGQVHPGKGVSEFVDAARILSRVRRNLHFLVVGADPDPRGHFAREMELKVGRLGLASSFTFTGFRRDAAALFGLMQVSVLASRGEALGRVVLESMAAGAPVVATCVGGVPEVVEDGVSGFLIPPRDPGAIARSVLRVLDMPHVERERMLDEGRRTVERFAVGKHVAKVTAVYDDLLGGTRKGGPA